MNDLRQRRKPIRSNKIRNSAKGETCTLRFVGVCRHDPETTVLCHIHDAGFGLGIKADDSSAVYGCDRCHAFLDTGWPRKISRTVLLEHIIRAMQETWRRQIERKLVGYPITIERPRAAAKVKPRKAAADRINIHSRTDWPKGRKLQSRPFPQKETIS